MLRVARRQILGIGVVGEQQVALFHAHRHTDQRAPLAWPGNAAPGLFFKQRAVHLAQDQAAIGGQELVRSVVERELLVGAAIHVGAYPVGHPYHETAQRPVAAAELEFPAAVRRQIAQGAQYPCPIDFRRRHRLALSLRLPLAAAENPRAATASTATPAPGYSVPRYIRRTADSRCGRPLSPRFPSGVCPAARTARTAPRTGSRCTTRSSATT